MARTPKPSKAAEALESQRATSVLAGASTPPLPAKRSVKRLALGVALVASGALGGAYLLTVSGDTVPALALTSDVPRGHTIKAQDLVEVPIPSDPSALRPVAADQLSEIVGQVAAADLPAGALLTEGQVTAQLIPAKGGALVGMSLTPAQMPATGVKAGDRVRVVEIPGGGGEVAGDPLTFSAVVAAVQQSAETGTTLVDVQVPASQAPAVSARAANGRVALVLDTPGE